MSEQELAPTPESSPSKSELELLEENLKSQHRLFCYEYLVDFNVERAATEAKLSKRQGLRLLRNPEITRFLKVLTDELANESLISRDMVQHEILNEFLPRAKGEKPIKGVDRDGSPWEACVTNMQAHGKAIDLMARHSGFTAQEIVKGGLTININEDLFYL